MARQSLSLLILKWFGFFLLFIFAFYCTHTRIDAARPTLESLQKKYRQAQARNNPQDIAKILRQMLDVGYKSESRYKQLGDLYFYIKKNKEALDTFREQAEWANTAKTWENLSDLLIWKKRNEEGLAALQKALSLDKNNQKLQAKLAGKFEYFKKISKSESLWNELYVRTGKSLESGLQLIKFYLRNSLVERAKGIMDELLQKDPDLAGSNELKLLNVKINTWLSKPEDALKALQQIDVSKVPESDLEYYFDLALFGGNTKLAETILNKLDSLGKDVWNKRLQLKKISSDPVETRKLIEERISDTVESKELLVALYETYRAERDAENEIKILEKIIEIDPLNETWNNLLLSHYRYHQKIEQGIDLFEDLLDDNEDSSLIRLNLSKLFLANQNYEKFNEFIQTVRDDKYKPAALELQISAAYQQSDKQVIFDVLKKVLEGTKNIPPEKLVVNANQNKDIPDDRYLELLIELQYLAEELGNHSEKEYYGRAAYKLLRSRYKQYPTENRLRHLLVLGEEYADRKKREEDFAIALKKLTDIPFLLKHYRFLMKKGAYEDAEEVLTKMLASSKELEETVQVAEHTFGFVSYNFSKKLFSDIIARDPNYTMGLKRLGQIGLYTDNYQEAIFYMNKYLKVNSYDPEAIFNLGEALYFSHQTYDAEEQFEKVTTLLNYPEMETYETLLAAISHLRLENYDKALKLLQEAQKKDPTDLSIKLNILETLVLLQKWQESLDLIKKENLDDEQKKKRARELVFKANIDAENSKEDSEFKAKLKYEELKAIVDLQLALRVNIIKHLCLEGLGREKEDRQLLEELAAKHPGNHEVNSTLAYFYLERDEDDKAIKYLGIARKIPPYDPILNHGHRELLHEYTTGTGGKFNQQNKANNGQAEYTQQTISVVGKIMLNELDKITYQVNSFSSERLAVESTSTVIVYDSSDDSTTTNTGPGTSTAGSTASTTYGIGYEANISNNFGMSLTHNYSAYIWFQDLTGYELSYQVTLHNQLISLEFDLFSDLPNSDDFDSAKAKVHNSGFLIEGSFPWKAMKQYYSFSYLSSTSRFANENYEGEPGQTVLDLGFTQYLMTYPNNLDISISYVSTSVSGEVAETDEDTSAVTYSHFYLPYTQLQASATLSRNWSEFLSNSFSVSVQTGSYQDHKTENRTTQSHSVTTNSLGIDLNYLQTKWSFSGFINYVQETTGEKSEVTSQGTQTTETIAEEKVITTTELGIAFNYLF